MKTITYEQFLEFEPCYLDGPKKKALMDSIAARRERWSALDILELEEIPVGDRLWSLLWEELIDAPLLHEFACRCAERALSRVKNPDPRSVRTIEIKRAWIRGEATDDELEAARAAALGAALGAAETSALDSAEAAAWYVARYAARYAARAAALDAAWAAALGAAWAAERQWQVEELQKMLMEVVENG